MNNGCSVREALSILDKNIPSFSFQQQENFAVLKPEPKIRIDKVLPVRHPALVRYLTRRNINVETAARYAKEIHYSLNDKRYFAIGLENISGGWELRNPYYKNASAPIKALMAWYCLIFWTAALPYPAIRLLSISPPTRINFTWSKFIRSEAIGNELVTIVNGFILPMYLVRNETVDPQSMKTTSLGWIKRDAIWLI